MVADTALTLHEALCCLLSSERGPSIRVHILGGLQCHCPFSNFWDADELLGLHGFVCLESTGQGELDTIGFPA